jgi:hypothetical protein
VLPVIANALRTDVLNNLDNLLAGADVVEFHSDFSLLESAVQLTRAIDASRTLANCLNGKCVTGAVNMRDVWIRRGPPAPIGSYGRCYFIGSFNEVDEVVILKGKFTLGRLFLICSLGIIALFTVLTLLSAIFAPGGTLLRQLCVGLAITIYLSLVWTACFFGARWFYRKDSRWLKSFITNALTNDAAQQSDGSDGRS